jgi:hypothetical protein
MSDSDFDVAWHAFAETDAQAEAPASVRCAVMAAWDTACQGHAPDTSRRSHGVSAVAALAAAVLLIATGLAIREGRERNRPDRASGNTLETRAAAGSTLQSRPANAATKPPSQRAARAVDPAVRLASALTGSSAVPLVMLTADRAFETESLQLVRLRVPRTSLQMFGVALLEPDAFGLVDVDVVVGDDGLPRNIHRIRAVVDGRQ